MALKIVICLVAAICLITGVSGVKYCWDGYYEVLLEDGTTTCLPCEDGTFMPKYDHQERQCFNCTTISNPLIEKMMSQCNKTHDAEIRCVEGYYREKPRNIREKGVCFLCKKCRYSGIPCKADADALCCQDENYVIEKNREDDFECRPKPWICGRGQFFNNVTFTCSPCLANTFMNVDVHSNTECYKCPSSFALPLHVKVDKSCNTTHPDVLRCETGYYLNNTMGSSRSNTGCSACMDCSKLPGQSHVGRQCSHSHDTVCCPDSSMTVVDKDGGPRCVKPSTESYLGQKIAEEQKDKTDLPIPTPPCMCCSTSAVLDQPNLQQYEGTCKTYKLPSKSVPHGCIMVNDQICKREHIKTESQENMTAVPCLIAFLVISVAINICLIGYVVVIKKQIPIPIPRNILPCTCTCINQPTTPPPHNHENRSDHEDEDVPEVHVVGEEKYQGLVNGEREINTFNEISNAEERLIGSSENTQHINITGTEDHCSMLSYVDGRDEQYRQEPTLSSGIPSQSYNSTQLRENGSQMAKNTSGREHDIRLSQKLSKVEPHCPAGEATEIETPMHEIEKMKGEADIEFQEEGDTSEKKELMVKYRKPLQGDETTFILFSSNE